MFKKRRGIKIPYNKQGLVYFTCVNYKDMPEDIQEKIKKLCCDIGGEEYYEVLFKVVTDSSKSIRSLAMEYYISEMSLYRFRKQFYELWDKNTP